MYSPSTVLPLLKFSEDFFYSYLKLIEKDPYEWISNLEANKFGLKGSISDKDFMINILNNLHKKYDIILNWLENCLTFNGDNAMMIKVIRETVNHLTEKN